MLRRLVARIGLAVLWGISTGALSGLPADAATFNVNIANIDGKTVTFIEVAGKLLEGDHKRFADLALGVDSGAVLLSGPGGNLIAGIEIGRAIRLKGFATIVASDDICASACAFAWLGGKRRFMGDTARIGFHAASTVDRPSEPSGVANALVGAYMNQLGFSLAAVAYVTIEPPHGMRWLTFRDASDYGIDIDRLSVPVTTGSEPRASPPTANNEGAEPGSPESWTGYGEWIQIFSRDQRASAVELAEVYRRDFKNVAVFLYDNGWFVVVLGPYHRGTAISERARLLDRGLIPPDSLVNKGSRFVEQVWGERPELPATSSLPPASTTHLDAVEAARSFFAAWSLPGPAALRVLGNSYADRVAYFGTPMRRADVLADKQKFFLRWPIRSYRIRPGADASCGDNAVCTVTGVIEWRAHDPARKETSEGTADFELRLLMTPDATILAETSTVTARRRY